MKAGIIRKIKFWGLRTYGNSFDNDVEVVWLCRVVHVEDGLKWQIIKNKSQWDFNLIEYDQECLNEYLVHEVEIVHEPMLKYSLIGHRGKALNLSDIPF